MFRTLILISIAVLFTGKIDAQQGRQYSFTHYSTANGSISNQVNAVVQDRHGYIWTATTDGLQRYDGTRYKNFRHKKNDPTSLPSNPVLDLMIDKKNNLWVMLASGKIGIFNTDNFTFRETLVTVKDPAALAATKTLRMDEYGNVFYVLMGWHLLTWNESKNEFSEAYNFLTLPGQMKIADLAQQPGTQKYWITAFGGGLVVYNRATSQWSYKGHNAEKEQAIDDLENVTGSNHLLFDKKGRLWFDIWRGVPLIYCYDNINHNLILKEYNFVDKLKTYYELHGFFQQRDGTIWVRGLGVLAQYQESEKAFQLVYNGYLSARSIYYDAVHYLYEDREKNIWVATRNNGLYRFNPSEEFFTNISHINRATGNVGSGSIESFAPTKWGTYLAGSWGDGIFEYDKDFNLLPTSIKGFGEGKNYGPTIWNMCLSSDSNTIWMSAQPGIWQVDQSKRTAKFYNPTILENRTVRQIAEDKQGNLWLGMQHVGLYKWNRSKGLKKFDDGLTFVTSVPKTQINKIMVDHQGLIWVGTANFGVYVVDPVTESVVYQFNDSSRKEFNIPENSISSMLEYSDTLMLISTGTTLNLYDRVKKEMYQIGGPETMSGYIASLERDRNGYIWVSTTSGLYRVNGYLKIFVGFMQNDGIDNDNFTLSASISLPDGRLAFGSSNQFVVFDPLMIKLNALNPGVRITDFKVMNKSLRVDSLLALNRIHLGPNSNSIAIDFSTLTYSNVYVIKYKLENLDKEWKVADRNNQAIYSYLPAGSYTLLIQSEDADGNKDDEITRIHIKIDPPFWKSWWFYTLIILTAAGLLYWFDRERMKRKQAIQLMRGDIAGNLHGEINTALNNINILSEMARLKSASDPNKAVEYIDQIHNKSHNMIISMDDMLWSLDPENDSMHKTVERMREYIDALNNRHSAYIDMLVDKNVEQLKLNMKFRHEAFILFKEGIQNMVQAGVTICHIHIGLEKGRLLFTMQFDTEGCDMQQLNNLFHRQDMERRVESMHAEMDIQVHKNSSTFLLKMPVE